MLLSAMRTRELPKIPVNRRQVALDSNDAAKVVATGGVVSVWNSSIGGVAAAAQSSGSLQPVTGGTRVFGHNGITFDGADDIMDIDDFAPDWDSINFSVAAVAQMDSDATDQFRGIIGDRFGAGAANWWSVGRENTDDTIKLEVGPAAALSYADTGHAPEGTGPQIYTFVKNAGTTKIYLNGALKDTEVTSDSDFGNTTNDLKIGQWASGGQNWDGEIFRVFIWDRILNDEEIYRINSILGQEYGVPLL